MYLFSIGYTVLVVLNKPHNLVRKGFPARFAEMDMYVKGGIPYPLHKVGLRVQRGGGAAGLAGVIVHRLSFLFISPFNSRLRNARTHINTGFFLLQNKTTPHWFVV